MSQRTTDYTGQAVRITYDRKLCMHAAECGRASRAMGHTMFAGGREQWCDPDAVPVELAVDVVERCPSGALHYERLDGGPAEAPPGANEITIAADGPYYLRGELEIDGQGEQGVPHRAALCRCGHSANKPFCDGAHKQAGFRDSGACGDPGPGNDGAGGPLAIKQASKGPLLLSGNFTIRTASGRVAFRGKKAALCRCGGSANKPFCDGAHKSNGFEG